MHQTSKRASATHLLLLLALAAPGAVLAYDNKDAIRDCESRLRSEYGLMDLRDARAEQRPGDKNYRVQGMTKVDGEKHPWTCEIEDRRVADVDYDGPRPSPIGSAAGGGSPEVVPRRSGELEVRMPSGCTALYDRDGELITRGSSCRSSDRRRAEEAVDSYLREQGDDEGRGNDGGGYGRGSRDRDGDEYGRDSGRERSGPPPEIMAGTNGEAEVIYENNCVVYYNQRGRRTNALPKCSDRQIERADRALRAYRREQGL